MIEGSEGGVKSLAEAKSICKEIGYPVLIKAAGGGGGKGMKIVEEEKHLESLFLTAKSEAKKFFNNDDYIVSNTPHEKNVNKFTLYVTPEAHSIVKNNSAAIKLLNDNYKLSIYKLENGENIIDEINIENFNKG